MGTMCPHPSRGLCVNIIGSFYCHCISGYRQNTTSLNLCDDIDECQEGTHNCEQKCTNTVGGFECSCHDGYEPLRSRSYSPGEFTCIDINECEKDVNLRNEDPSRPKLCEGTCTNTDGGYECSCPNGYFLNLTNNRTCEDIDECTSNTLICQSSDVCLNTRGGYKCFEFKCPDKYEEDASKVK
jgi:fibulin 1/2